MTELICPTVFSIYGFYMALIYNGNKKRVMDIEFPGINGIYLKSYHGKSFNVAGPNYGAIRFVLEADNRELDYEYSFQFNQVKFSSKSLKVSITFSSDDTLLIEGKGSSNTMILDNMPISQMDNIVQMKRGGRIYYILTSYKSKTRYIIYANQGTVELVQNYYGDSYIKVNTPLQSKLLVKPIDNYFQIIVKEVKHNMCQFDFKNYDFKECCQNNLSKFNRFYEKFKSPMDKYLDAYRMAVYIIWSQTVRAEGNLKRDVALPDAFVLSFWSGDNIFEAYGLMHAHPQMAYDQLMAHFDVQDELGCIPGSMTDGDVRWLYLKPPAHGLVLKTMLSYLQLDYNQKIEVYEKLGKLVNYWLKYRDSNEDGICEYIY